MISRSWPTTRYALVALLVFAADQLSKWAILRHFAYQERANILAGFFDLTLVYNPGSAFSFLANAGGWQKFFFLGLAVVISAYLWRGIVKRQFGFWGLLGAAMIIGGALGNGIDRIIHGHVIDFIMLYYQDWYYPAFNIADSGICVGAALLVIDSFTSDKAQQQGAPSSKNP